MPAGVLTPEHEGRQRTDSTEDGRAMVEIEVCCPNCETVMERRFHLHMPEHVWYECSICGHRAVPRGSWVVTSEDELDDQPPLHL